MSNFPGIVSRPCRWPKRGIWMSPYYSAGRFGFWHRGGTTYDKIGDKKRMQFSFIGYQSILDRMLPL